MKKIFKSIQRFFIKLFGGVPNDLYMDTMVKYNNLESLYDFYKSETEKYKIVNDSLNKTIEEYRTRIPTIYTYRVEPTVLEAKLSITNSNPYEKQISENSIKDMMINQISDQIKNFIKVHSCIDPTEMSTLYVAKIGVVPVIKEEYEEYEKNKKKCI